jgi:ribosome-associated translation inhibitor RaiA
LNFVNDDYEIFIKDIELLKKEIKKSNLITSISSINDEIEKTLEVLRDKKKLTSLVNENKGNSIVFIQRVKIYVESLNEWLNIPKSRSYDFIYDAFIFTKLIQYNDKTVKFSFNLKKAVERINQKKIIELKNVIINGHPSLHKIYK